MSDVKDVASSQVSESSQISSEGSRSMSPPPFQLAATPADDSSGEVMQLVKQDTHFGSFNDEYYEEIKNKGTVIGADMLMKFTPNAKVDADKIALSQSVKNMVDGKDISIDPLVRRMILVTK